MLCKGVSLLRRLLIPVDGLRRIGLHTRSVGIAPGYIELSLGRPLFRRLVEPLKRLPVVGKHAETPDQIVANCNLPVRVPQLRGPAQPLRRLEEGLFDAQSPLVGPPQIAHGKGAAALRRLLIPVEGLLTILLHADAVGIAHSQVILRVYIAQLCRLAEPLSAQLRILPGPDPVEIALAQGVLRPGVSALCLEGQPLHWRQLPPADRAQLLLTLRPGETGGVISGAVLLLVPDQLPQTAGQVLNKAVPLLEHLEAGHVLRAGGGENQAVHKIGHIEPVADLLQVVQQLPLAQLLPLPAFLVQGEQVIFHPGQLRRRTRYRYFSQGVMDLPALDMLSDPLHRAQLLLQRQVEHRQGLSPLHALCLRAVGQQLGQTGVAAQIPGAHKGHHAPAPAVVEQPVLNIFQPALVPLEVGVNKGSDPQLPQRQHTGVHPLPVLAGIADEDILPAAVLLPAVPQLSDIGLLIRHKTPLLLTAWSILQAHRCAQTQIFG